MIISVHVHKTAGRSFNEALKTLYGHQLHRIHHDKSLTAPTLLKEKLGFSQPHLKKTDVADQCQCIHGHFKASRFISQFPDAKLAIWLRNPLQRAASHYYFLGRESRMLYRPLFRLIPDTLGLKLYLQFSPHGNLYSRVLDGIPINQFAFVGLSEHYESGIDLFCKIFELHTPLQKHSINVNPERIGTSYCIPKSVEEKFIRSHSEDFQIYQQAQRRFFELCRTYEVPVAPS